MRQSAPIYAAPDDVTREYVERHGLVERWRKFSYQPQGIIIGSLTRIAAEISNTQFQSFLAVTSQAHIEISEKTGQQSKMPGSRVPANAHERGGLAIAYVASRTASTVWNDVDAFILGRYGVDAEGLKLERGKDMSSHEFARAALTRSRALLGIGLATVSAVHHEMTGPLTRIYDALYRDERNLRHFEAGVGLALGVLVNAEFVAADAAAVAEAETTNP